MSWTIAITVALLTAIITGATTAFVADHVTRAMKVSEFEGGRGYMVMFLVLAGVVGGLIIGIATSSMVGAAAWGMFWKTIGYALVASNGIVLAIGGMCLLSVPRKPLLEGEEIALEIEVFIPDDLAPRGKPGKENMRMSLYAGKDDNRYVDIDFTRLRHAQDMLVIHTEASLNTVTPGRMLTITIDDRVGYTLDMPLGPAPRKEDLVWTERIPTRLSTVTNARYEYTRVLVRYRVIKKGRPLKG